MSLTSHISARILRNRQDMRDPQGISLFSVSHSQWTAATYTGHGFDSLTELSAEASVRTKSGALIGCQWGSGSCPGESAALCLYAQQLHWVTESQNLTLSLSGQSDQHFVSCRFSVAMEQCGASLECQGAPDREDSRFAPVVSLSSL